MMGKKHLFWQSGRFWTRLGRVGEMTQHVGLVLGARGSFCEMSLGLELCQVTWIISYLGLNWGL